ncbi:hypothetical protein AB0D12_41165 [Streptomyces sp. NPDC048479]|uniref:hypothetical protein n=1 Tax=Streptomyces sp. NPDC048479 TaxID=3154725 RepID=UPI003444D3B7
MGATGPAGTTVNIGASAFRNFDQTIPNDTDTLIDFNGVDYATNMVFDPTHSSLVVTTSGRYLLKSRIAWTYSPNVATGRRVSILVNGAAVAFDLQDAETIGQVPQQPIFGSLTTQEVSVIRNLNVGDRIQLAVYQNTGVDATSRSFGGSLELYPKLQAEWLAP